MLVRVSRSFYESYLKRCNQHRFSELDKFVAAEVAVNGIRVGLDGYQAGLRSVVDAFADYHWSLRRLMEEPPWLSVLLHDTGTHTGARWGIAPTGRRIRTHEIAFYRFEQGKIAEVWVTADDLHVIDQLRADDQ